MAALLGALVTIFPPSNANRSLWLVGFGVLFFVSAVAAIRQQRVAIQDAARIDKKLKAIHDDVLGRNIQTGEAKAQAAAHGPKLIARYQATENDQPHHLDVRNFGDPAFDIRLDPIPLGKHRYGGADQELEIRFETAQEILGGNRAVIQPEIYEDGEYSLQFGHNMYTPLRYAYIGKSWGVAMQTPEGQEIPDDAFKPHSWPLVVKYRDATGGEYASVHKLQFDVVGSGAVIFEQRERLQAAARI